MKPSAALLLLLVGTSDWRISQHDPVPRFATGLSPSSLSSTSACTLYRCSRGKIPGSGGSAQRFLAPGSGRGGEGGCWADAIQLRGRGGCRRAKGVIGVVAIRLRGGGGEARGGRGGGKQKESSSESSEEEELMIPNWKKMQELGRRFIELKKARLGVDIAGQGDDDQGDSGDTEARFLDDSKDDSCSHFGISGLKMDNGGADKTKSDLDDEEVKIEQEMREEIDRLTDPEPRREEEDMTRREIKAARKRTYGIQPQEFLSESRMDGPLWGFGDGCSGALGVDPLPVAMPVNEDGEQEWHGGPDDRYSPTSCAGLEGLKISLVAAGRDHTVIATDSGVVMSCGWNEQGQLGLGHCVLLPEQCHFGPVLDVLPRLPVKKLVCGEFHTVAVMQDGTAWGWGCDGDGQIGLGNMSKASPTPMQIKFGPTAWPSAEVKDVAAGGFHTVFLLMSGQVFACGRNHEGQLGLGFYSQIDFMPDPTPLVSRLLQVRRQQRIPEGVRASGSLTTVDPTPVPTEILHLRKYRRKVAQVACGRAHTLFVLEPPPAPTPVAASMGDTVGGEEGDLDGEADTGYSHPLLLACGANIFSELGLGVCETGRCLPVPVPLPKTREAHIRIVASGSHHSFCVLSDGVVLGWGRNHDGQLGKGDTEQVFEPTILWDGCDGMGPIRSISCGESHTLVLLSKARQGRENVNGEEEGEAGQFEDTTAGGRKRDCVGEEGGDVFVCGRNQRGQLGIGAPSLSQLVLPPMADKGVDEAVFGEHPPVLCPRRVESLCGRVRALAAGAQTSFAVPL